MNLYKLMLVDDEEEVRKSIIKKIDWQSLGFSVVADAENGAEAIEKIDLYEPDVVMTDIKMPYMDGLTLIEKVSKKNPSIKFVIFSGFDDFEYAKEAIRLGVSEYILKPIDAEELSSIFINIKKGLDKEKEARNDIERLRKHYIANLPLLRIQFLNNLVKSKLSEKEISLRLKEYDLDIADANYYIVLSVDIEYEKMTISSELGLQKELIALSIIDFIDDKLKKDYKACVFNSLIDNKILAIISLDKEENKNILLDVLRAICKESIKLLGITISMGLGKVLDNISELAFSYNLSLEALGYKQIIGSGDLIYIEDVEPIDFDSLYFEDKDEEDLSLAIKFGNELKIEEVILRLVKKMRSAKVHMRQKQVYILSMINTVIRIMQKYELESSLLTQEEYNHIDLSEKIKEVDSFVTWINEVCLDIYKQISKNRENTGKKVIEDAKRYILENYMNKELSVELVCKHLHMSTAYFSTFFKKEVGKTCIAYITDLRLEKALDLLNKTDYKTYIIAEMVGYPEQNYFSYVFKKKYGISPNKYKNQTKDVLNEK